MFTPENIQITDKPVNKREANFPFSEQVFLSNHYFPGDDEDDEQDDDLDDEFTDTEPEDEDE